MTMRDIGFMVLINLIWGATPLVFKYAIGDMPPLMLMGLRFILASALLLPLTKWHAGQMGKVFAIAGLAGMLSFASLALGLARIGNMTPVGIANQLNVPFATLLSILILGETVRWRRWLGMTLAFSGGVIVAFDPRIVHYLDGFVLVTVASFANAVSLIIMRMVRAIKPLEMQAWIAHASWPSLIVLSLLSERGPGWSPFDWSWKVWLAALFGALGTTMFAHAGFYKLLQRHEVSKIAPFMLLSPLFTILLGVVLSGDELTLRMAVGGAMTLAGTAIITFRDRHIVEDRVAP